jgi:exodeoxyribonuclease VIII
VTAKDSIAEYHARPGVSKTKLWCLLNDTPAKFKWLQEHPEPPTAAMQFGSALHKYVLEPDSFFYEYAVAPQCDRRTKTGKEEYQKFVDSVENRTVISADDMVLISEMTAAIRKNPRADFLLRGEVETSYYWQDEMTGLDCQARPDSVRMLDRRGLIVDLKTCARADTETMVKQAYALGYDMQAAMFKEAVEREYGISCDFLFVCVEKEPPYLVNILQADDLMIKSGQDRFREAIGIYKSCLDSGNWYGYEGAFGMVNTLGLPKWAAKEIE